MGKVGGGSVSVVKTQPALLSLLHFAVTVECSGNVTQSARRFTPLPLIWYLLTRWGWLNDAVILLCWLPDV